MWTYTITSSNSQTVAVSVTSKAKDPSKPTIEVRPYWGKRDYSVPNVVPITGGVDTQKLLAYVQQGRMLLLMCVMPYIWDVN